MIVMNIVYFNENQKDEWDSFVGENAEDGGLLQSWQWGEFQAALRKKIWRIGVRDDNNKLLTVCFSFRDDLALRQKTIEVYRGPIIVKSKKSENEDSPFRKGSPPFKGEAGGILQLLLSELKKIAMAEEAMVVRMDFGITKSSLLEITDYKLQELELKRANRDIQPRSTFFIDLSKSEEEILSEMKSKHRYNIRLAGKKEVEVFLANQESLKENFSDFWELIKLTSERDGFAIHEKEYYWQMIDVLRGDVKMYLAKFDNNIIAGSLVGCFGKVCVYMHGASDDRYKNVMAPYLLQWQAIRDAKAVGKKYYDLGGVKSASEASSSQKGWDGITRFKTGFCPSEKLVEFLGLWNLPVNKIQYYKYNILRFIVKFIKR